MSINNKYRCYIGFILLFTTSYAVAGSCTRTSEPAYRVEMKMGTVVVDPDLPVGSIIKKQDFGMQTNATYIRCTGNVQIDADVIFPGLTPIGGKVYQTNVQGIGLKFHRESGPYTMTYPDFLPLNAGFGTNYTLNNSVFTLSIIKTAEVTGSGVLASGDYTTYGYKSNHNPYLVSYLDANAITIVSPSCRVDGERNQQVYLDPIKRTQLTGVGATAGEKDFDIKLICSGGVSQSGFANIKMTFSGNEYKTLDKGVLENTSTTNIAQGIGIQVLDKNNGKKPLEFERKYNVGRLVNKGDYIFNMKYSARYYQYESKTSAGEVNSKMIFNITYD